MGEKILVTQALNELKTLDARILKTLTDASFIAAAKNVDKNAKPGVTKEKFNKEAKASVQSYHDLVSRREAIKAAIIASNAVTNVQIGKNIMTVAKAIDTKTSINYDKMLLEEMKKQYGKAMKTVTDKNAAVDDRIDDLVATAYGKEGKEKISESDYEAIAKPYKTANEYVLVDPIGLKDEIDALEEYITTFESTVDSQLQISNCTTTIEI